MSDAQYQPSVIQIGKTINLIPVGLKEAALDSPTFRATAVHFSEQIDAIERWLDGYVKSTSKLNHEVSALESLVNNVLAQSVPPAHVSEAVLDHDYTLLATKRYGEAAREFWSYTISGMKKMDSMLIEPIRAFLQGDLRSFKDTRRYLEQSQKQLDNLQAKYSAQAKTKEPSSLREDAFQLHEARKTYLKASMDYCVVAPQLRTTLDKLLVKLFSDQWREMRRSRESLTGTFERWGTEMERIRGWSHELEIGEKAFKRELQVARLQIEERAELATRPSRELEDYSISTVPHLGSKGPSMASLQSPAKILPVKSEKQGWLNLRTLTGKPTRTVWVRRWFFVKNGIFGWLVQGSRSGGVEESERIGVLLCSIRPAPQEERRFCFEVKTKDNSILLQAETQQELMDWIGAFEIAKQKALDDPASTESPTTAGTRPQDPAFAITPPSAPEFAASVADFAQMIEEPSGSGLDRTSGLPVPERDGNRSSFDVSSHRRHTGLEKDGESSRDHAARIIQKLDLHRKSTAGSQLTSNVVSGPSPSSSGVAGGGIASLISASHTILPVGPGVPLQSPGTDVTNKVGTSNIIRDLPPSTLAPSTLANPPAPTNLSKAAVVVNGERGVGVGRTDGTGGMPSGIMANLWGSSNWGYINRLEGGELKSGQDQKSRRLSNPPSPWTRPTDSPQKVIGAPNQENQNPGRSMDALKSPSDFRQLPSAADPQNAISLEPDAVTSQKPLVPPQEFPNYYPLQLKTQDAQFRLLFPNVRREEKLVLVFRATWNPNDQQEFPGRIYVTAKDIYFYSHHLGLVLITGVSLTSISEVTAASGRECDFLFLHLKEGVDKSGFNRITVKTFLEPLRLLQRRLNFLVQNCNSDEPLGLEAIMKTLIKVEHEDPGQSPSLESWEDVSLGTPADDGSTLGRRYSQKAGRDLRATIHVDRDLYRDSTKTGEGKDVTKFKLPAQPVIYTPQGMTRVAVEKQFEISPKALFHIMFGDKSAVWQLLYHERRAQYVKQGPWTHLEPGYMRREFEYQAEYLDMIRRPRQATIVDYQMIDVLNDHLCYVVTDKKTPWHLPKQRDFMLVSKVVITHVAKSRCKLVIYIRVDWSKTPTITRGLIEKRALEDLELDALDLADVISDQVRKLGAQSRTKKAIRIFGHVGQQTQTSQIAAHDSPLTPQSRRPMKQRTLTRLFLALLASLAELVISSLMAWTFAILKWTWKTSSANSIILSLLALSVLTNLFYSSRDTSEWWSERNAGKFMARLGVGPNLMMSKAVYLRDIDEVVSNHTVILGQSVENPCYSTFLDIANITDMDAPYHSPTTSTSTGSTARRLRRTRQHLGSYRHDLLVAMRVVNSVEQEMLRAEWENWLLDETNRCKQ
ncbi:MAG: SNF1-interacting protein, partial [Pleopsidium flavum]